MARGNRTEERKEEEKEEEKEEGHGQADVTGILATAWGRLMTRIGVDNPTIQELERYGVTSLLQLEKYKDDGITRFCTNLMKYPHPQRPQGQSVFVSPTSLETLKAIRYCIRTRRRTGQTLDPDACTDDEIYRTELRLEELDGIKKAAEGNDVEKPPKLKRMSDWLTFWDSWVTYTSSIRGAADIPITYVNRKKEEVDHEDLEKSYRSDDIRYYHTTQLSGLHYAADSQRVWSEIKVLTHGGPGWDHIKRYKDQEDGRQAVLQLQLQALSTAGTKARKEKAHDQLEDISYNGPKKSWTLENYVNGHLKAHNELLECGDPFSESQKIRMFLRNLTDPRMEQDKRYLKGRPDEYDTFDKVQQYMLLVSEGDRRGASKHPRQISAVGEDSAGKRKKPKGDGKFKGKLEARNYTIGEWRSMDDAQQQKVRELRARKKNSKGNRKVAKVSESCGDGSDSEEPVTEPEKDAGKQFGRAAHKKSKKKDGE